LETLSRRQCQLLLQGPRRTLRGCPVCSTPKTGTSLESEPTGFVTGIETPRLYLLPPGHPQGIEGRNPNFRTHFDPTDSLLHHLLRHRLPHHHLLRPLHLREETAHHGHERTPFQRCQRMRSWIGETGCGGLEQQPVKKRRRELLKQVVDHFQTDVAVLREMKRRRRLRRMCTKGSFPKETFEGRRLR